MYDRLKVCLVLDEVQTDCLNAENFDIICDVTWERKLSQGDA